MIDTIGRLRLRSVVITNISFNVFAGSQLVSLDLAVECKRAGVERVLIVTDKAGGKLVETARASGIEVVEVFSAGWEQKLPEQIDLLWGHHWPLVGALCCLVPVRFRHLVLSSLSCYEPLEHIWLGTRESDVIVFNSCENLERQAQCHERSPLAIIPNSLPPDWFAATSPPPAALARLAIVSSHVPGELRDAAEIAGANGLSVDIVGLSDQPRFVDSAFIDSYDAIVSIGHTVPKALARERPVYLYDRFGGPGWLSATNLDASELTNHSGRSVGRRKPAERIVSEIQAGYAAARAEAASLRETASARYNLAANVAAVLDRLPPRAVRGMDALAASHATERLITMSYWATAGRSRLSPLSNITSYRRLAFELRCALSRDEIVKYIDICIDGLPVERKAHAVIESVDNLPITGNLVFADGCSPEKIEFVRGDGLAWRCRINLASPWIGPRVGFSDGHDRALFVATIALEAETEGFGVLARHPTRGVVEIATLRARLLPE